MKVLYFHQYFTTPKGYTGTRSYEMAKRLLEKGHSVTMVCASNQVGNTGLIGKFKHGFRKGNVEGIEVIEFDLSYSNYDGLFVRALKFLKFAIKSIKVALFENYDLIFATSTPLTAGIPGVFAKIFRRKKFVFEVRDLWPELPVAMNVIKNPMVILGMKILEWCSYHAADRCIGLAPGIVDGIISKGIAPNRVSMIPNGCDIEFFQSQQKKLFIHEAINDDDFVAVFTGAHGMANGLDAVLNAAAVLKKRDVEKIKFLFVGNGKVKPHLLERKAKEKLDNCIFIDSIPKTEMPSLLKSVDLGLMILANVPAFYNGTSPNKFFDYLASGLPVLNNYPGWVARYIEGNKCGQVVTPENPELFANALITLREKGEDLLMMKNNSLKLAKGKFDRVKLSEKFVKVLEETYAQKSCN